MQAKVPIKDQELTDKINSLVQNSEEPGHDEESKVAASESAEVPPSDFLISTGSGDDESSSGRKYKIVRSCMDL